MRKQLFIAWLLLVFSIALCCLCHSQTIPLRAYKYRSDLRREVGYAWGIEQPLAVFAAQIHQESAWQPRACSRYASGLGQFTPGTEADMTRWYPELAELGGALNPRWAIRALVLYDRRLWNSFAKWATEDDHWRAVLHGYNAGPGSLQKERRAAADPSRYAALPCKRRPQACQETAGYVRRILDVLTPRYGGF